jgi:hypothetical protein
VSGLDATTCRLRNNTGATSVDQVDGLRLA